MEHKTTNQTLRQKIQQLQDNREQSKNKNQVTTNTYAQVTYPRNLEGAPTTEATSSTTMSETYDPTTSTYKDKENSTLFGTQVRSPGERHTPTETQAGMAAPPKHIFRADTGFVGDHTKPPVRPPSSGQGIPPSRVLVEVETSHRLEWHAKEAAKTDTLIDFEAALLALLRPHPSPAPPKLESGRRRRAHARGDEVERDASVPTDGSSQVGG